MNPSGTTGAVLRGLEIVGDLLASEDLTIQGNFDGQITMPDHHLSIDAGSSVKGKVVARTVTIGGTLDGSILAPRAHRAHAHRHRPRAPHHRQDHARRRRDVPGHHRSQADRGRDGRGAVSGEEIVGMISSLV